MIGRGIWKGANRVSLGVGLANDSAEVTTEAAGWEPLIAILLSTYNGERYLQKQLDSISDQTYKIWQILWRDDGSSDASRAIMEAVANSIGCGRCIGVCPTDACLGAAKSFVSLLREAGEYRLTAFADQYDVWLPDKFQRAVERKVAQKPGMPILHSERQIIVDEHLKRRALSPLPCFGAGFQSAVLQNIVTGCRAMLNREAVQLVNRVEPPDEMVHDWRAHIVIAVARGSVIIDPAPAIPYRQHGHKAIGDVSPLIPRAVKAIQRGPAPFPRQLEKHAITLENAKVNLPQSVQATNARILRALLRGRMARLSLLRDPAFRRETWRENLGMTARIRGAYRLLAGSRYGLDGDVISGG